MNAAVPKRSKGAASSKHFAYHSVVEIAAGLVSSQVRILSAACMVEPLEQLLKDVKVSDSVRDDMFNYCVRRGYYKGVERDEARRQFVTDVNTESPKQKQMAQDYVPTFLDARADNARQGRSMGVAVTGAAAYAAGAVFGAGLLALGGAVAMAAGGVLGAYYALKKFLR